MYRHWSALLLLLAVAGCSAAPQRVASPVLEAAGEVVAVHLVDLESRRELARLSSDEAARLNGVLGRVEESTGYVATTPPWDAAIVLKTRSGGEVVVHFVATALRFSRHTPWCNGATTTDPEWEARSVDLDLSYEDSEWLGSVLGNYLGGTRVKEYHSIDRKPTW